jgi:hypothetical protein
MSILEELHELLDPILPTENDFYSGVPLETYAVLIPLDEPLGLYADDLPLIEMPIVRISVFTKNNYISLVKQLKKLLLENDFTITECRKVEFEEDTKYHHYAIEVQKDYTF